MLRFLKIKNLAVIDEAELEVGKGFVCLTGESGAGKSVLIDALLLLGGSRASSDLVRTGCDKAIVEAEFELDSVPGELELMEDNQLLLRREVTKEGKSRAFVNGVMVPNNILTQYGELAFEIHGQHGQQRLLKARRHRHIFEEQVGLTDQVDHFERQYERFRAAFKHYWELKDTEADRLKEIDFIRMQLQEIDDVDPGEADADLDSRLKIARNRETIRSNQYALSDLLNDELVGNLDQAEKLIESLREFMPELVPYLEEIQTISTSLHDLATESRLWDVPGDEKLTELERRESVLNKLYLKYGRNLEEVLAERQRLAERLELLDRDSTGLGEQWKYLVSDYKELRNARDTLHKAREKAALGFAKKVRSHLQDLALKNAAFELENLWPEWPEKLEETRELNLSTPAIQFLFSPNVGETARALSRVASGGELSRVLLALISAFDRRSSRLLVFDEIDAGLGGETAHSCGAKLKQLGDAHQVLCVTHFAQVARFADQQIKIEKAVKKGRTFTRLVSCDYEGRISELARLMGGDTQAESLRDHARALLAPNQQTTLDS